MPHVDVQQIASVMDALPRVLEHEELAVRRCLPRLAPADVLDTALRRSLVCLHFDLDQESFEYLRWKVALSRAEGVRLRAVTALSDEAGVGRVKDLRKGQRQ